LIESNNKLGAISHDILSIAYIFQISSGD